MISLLRSLFVLLLIAGPAGALEPQANSDVGQGLACNTPQQLERYVALRNGGRDARGAVEIVNAEVHDPTACGIVVVAFTNSEPVAEKTMQGRHVKMVKITVHAISNGATWQPVPDTDQYAIVADKGEEI